MEVRPGVIPGFGGKVLVRPKVVPESFSKFDIGEPTVAGLTNLILPVLGIQKETLLILI